MQKKAKKETRDYFKLLPIALILAIIPLIVYAKKIEFDEAFAKLWKGPITDQDFFSYYKMYWFIVLTCISVLFFFIYISTKKIKLTFPKIFIPLGIYIILVFLSSSFSEYHKQAFFGFPERYEGFFTILCYVTVCFICSILVTSEFDIKYLGYFLAFGVFVLSLIGISQFFGFDFLQTAIGKKMILPLANQGDSNSLIFNFPKQYIYSTLYNPNYVGGYFAIILSISLVVYLSVSNLKLKIISGLFCLLSFINLLGSLSSTGYVSMIVSAIIILLFLRKTIKRNILALLAIFVCFVAIGFYMNFYSEGKISESLKIASNVNYSAVKEKFVSRFTPKAEPSTKSNIPNTLMLMDIDLNANDDNLLNSVNASNNLIALNEPSSTEGFTSGIINDIYIDKNSLSLYTSATDVLVVNFDANTLGLSFFDNNNIQVQPTTQEKDGNIVITFQDARFNAIKLIAEKNIIVVEAPNTTFNLAITVDGFKIITPAGNTTDIIKAKSFGFKGYEHWGSYRGYIWSRSIPMLKDTILLGHGADTYALYFPQNDYVAKLKYTREIYIIIDKPHNHYLQIAINTGVLSLFAFLIFVVWYYISALKLYIKGVFNVFFAGGVACLASVTAFLVSSLANDSTISVSITFWIIIGVGIACNRLYSKSLEVSKPGK